LILNSEILFFFEGLALLGAVAKPAPKKGRGKAAASAAKGGELLDYSVEYAKSGRAACRGCLEKIEKVSSQF